MIVNNDVFVKLNYKNIGELKSLIIDSDLGGSKKNKYMMCAGNYNKDGWTFVFKASSVKEAEALISNNKFSPKILYNQDYQNTFEEVIDEKIDSNINIHMGEPEIVEIPAWM